MAKTKVIFRKFPEGEIIAAFPEIRDYPDQDLIDSYMNIGQHGPASIHIINELQPATHEEYSDLYDELISIGYDLVIS